MCIIAKTLISSSSYSYSSIQLFYLFLFLFFYIYFLFMVVYMNKKPLGTKIRVNTCTKREKNLHVLIREKYNHILIGQPRTQVNLQKEELGNA